MTHPTQLDIRQRFRGELVLCFVALIWGTTYIAIQDAMAVWPPMSLVTVRFGLAFLCFLPTLVKGCGDLATWLKGMTLGVFLFMTFGLQNLGLVHTTSPRVAFAAALVTVYVPLFAFVVMRTRWRSGTYFASAAAGAGVFIMMGRDLGPGVRLGDFLAMGAAAGYAIEVLLLGHFTRKPGTLLAPMLVAQFGTTALLAAAASWTLAEPLPEVMTEAWQMVAYLGIVSTAMCLAAQMYGQSRTTSTRAAFIYALEPISAAAFAWALQGQRLSQAEWIGGSLIILAAVIADQALPSGFWSRLSRRQAATSSG